MRSQSPRTLLTTKYILLGITLVGFALRLFKVTEQSLWGDEFFSAYVTSLPPLEMLNIVIGDRVHPPLYYILLTCWQWLGNTPFIVRYLSIIFGVWAIPSIFILGKAVAGIRVGLLSSFLIAISPLHIWYSQETRMQTLLVLMLVLTHFFLIQVLTNNLKRDWIGYTLFLLASIYSHYFALLILPLHFILFAYYARPLFKQWFKKMILIGMLFSIWAILLGVSGGMQNANIGWIPPIVWYDFILTLVTFTAGKTINPLSPLSYINLLIILSGLASACYLYYYNRKSTVLTTKQKIPSQINMIMLLLWFIVPLGIIWLVSLDIMQLSLSFYMDRYLIISMPPLLILSSIGLIHITNNRKYSLSIVITSLIFFNAIPLQNMYNNDAFKRDDWKGAFKTLTTLYKPTDVLLLSGTGGFGGYRYYASDNIEYKFIYKQSDESIMTAIMPEIKNQYQRLWLLTMTSQDVIDPHGFPQTQNNTFLDNRELSQKWLDSNYSLVNEWGYSGVRLSLYDLLEIPD